LGIYQRLIVPRLINAAMRNKRLVPLRERQVALARGRVLEIGIGSGLNLPFYRRDIEAVIGIDPSLELLTMARKHTAWLHFPVKLLHGPAEALPLEDQSVDSVVITWTLCSVAEPGRVLAEARRVLQPGAALIFVEHGQAPEAGVRRWQDRLTPLWRKLAGGCHLNRSIEGLIAQAGFQIADLETGYLVKGPRPFTFHYRGIARA
jgi:ubiquinone/menaquinone biosynthesis C-methylase UbiE